MSEGSENPPAYTASSSSSPLTHGFPTGYFVIRHMATKRLLDVGGFQTADGTDVVLWPEKEQSLVEGLRDPRADNQIFFVDHAGALCSLYSGHALDIQDGMLVLRHRRPYTIPFPNKYSHPLPVFSYDMRTGLIRATFTCDPAYPTEQPADPRELDVWRSKDFVLSSVPMRAPPSLVDTASDFFISAASQLSLGLGLGKSREGAEFEVDENEVVDADRGDDEDVEDDNSPENRRYVRVDALPLGWNEKRSGGGGKRDRARRRWVVVPLVKGKNSKRSST